MQPGALHTPEPEKGPESAAVTASLSKVSEENMGRLAWKEVES